MPFCAIDRFVFRNRVPSPVSCRHHLRRPGKSQYGYVEMAEKLGAANRLPMLERCGSAPVCSIVCCVRVGAYNRKIRQRVSFVSSHFSLTAGWIFSWRFCSLGGLVSFGLLFPFDKIKANISDCATIVKWLTKRRRRFAVFFCFFPKIRNFCFFY